MCGQGGKQADGHIVEKFADFGGAALERHKRLRHRVKNRRRLRRKRGNHLERIKAVFRIDRDSAVSHRAAGVFGAGIEIALRIENYQRAVVVQDIGDNDAGGL